MLTHLLFSIAALVFMIILIITYFSYKKDTNSVRSKIYVSMIWLSLILIFVEIIEGITYVYNIWIVFSLMWKLHSIIMILFIAFLFYYYLSVEERFDDFWDIFWDKNKILSIRNLFSISFFIIMITSIVFVRTYPMGLTMFYFYTRQSIRFLLVLYAIYILYNFYIVYIKSKKNNFEINDYIVLIGTFILFIVALVFEYRYSEVSIYSTLFTLVLILLYYFKENEDLLIIEELQAIQNNLIINNNNKLNSFNELISNLEIPLTIFSSINHKLCNSNNLTDDEINSNLTSLNSISNYYFKTIGMSSSNRYSKYRIDELIRNVNTVITPYIGNKPIEFLYQVDSNIPAFLFGDSLALQKVIINLIINAIQNTEVGRVNLSVIGERTKDYILLKIKVSDTGMGIKKEDFDKVFSNNIRSNDDSYHYGNLVVAKKCVESLNGEIHFDSFYGAGSTFYATIPQSIASELTIAQVPLNSEAIQISNCNLKKVLLLDNEDYSSSKLTNILKKYNFDIKCVSSGVAAINTIKCDETYDLIIITDNITDMDFVKTGKLMKQLSNYVKVPPIVALYVNHENLQIDNYFDEVLIKPMDLKKLDDIIKKRFV